MINNGTKSRNEFGFEPFLKGLNPFLFNKESCHVKILQTNDNHLSVDIGRMQQASNAAKR